MHSYGRAAEAFAIPGVKVPLHGFFRAVTGTQTRFYSPRELAVAQGFPWNTPLPGNHSHAWALLGNAIPPPMAATGLALAAFMASPPNIPPQEALPRIIRRLCDLSHGQWHLETNSTHTRERRDNPRAPEDRSRSPHRVRLELLDPAATPVPSPGDLDRALESLGRFNAEVEARGHGGAASHFPSPASTVDPGSPTLLQGEGVVSPTISFHPVSPTLSFRESPWAPVTPEVRPPIIPVRYTPTTSPWLNWRTPQELIEGQQDTGRIPPMPPSWGSMALGTASSPCPFIPNIRGGAHLPRNGEALGNPQQSPDPRQGGGANPFCLTG
jgi:hypothetical protein